MAIEMTVPLVQFNKRAIPEGKDDYEWVNEDSAEIFGGRRVVVFSLPGAFTPTCSSTHLPGYEAKYDEILEQDVDDAVAWLELSHKGGGVIFGKHYTAMLCRKRTREAAGGWLCDKVDAFENQMRHLNGMGSTLARW